MTDATATIASSSSSSSELIHRNFFDQYADELPPTHVATSSAPSYSSPSSSSTSNTALLSYIHRSVLGRLRCIDTPCGWRRSIYCDYTASGKPLSFLESYMRDAILPTYANTHTLTSYTGLQTTLYRKEARDILLRNMRGSKDDVVLFTGSGTTAALKMLLHILNVSSRAQAFQKAGHAGSHTIVVLGPYEHHSNILPWREAGAECVVLKEGEGGSVNLEELEKVTKEMAEKHPHALKIGSFSAASNVSGILTDTIAVSRILHASSFLSVWDYASAAPYVEIDANPSNDPALAKDAIMLSTHKFVGGPGASGALLVKKKHCLNRTPNTPGGGTVFYVTKETQRYLENIEEREEGGTPDILASIRAGVVWHLKEQVGIRTIAEYEGKYAKLGVERMLKNENIVLIGHPSAPRLPIFSFLVRCPKEWNSSNPTTNSNSMFLHSSFISALLNDFFGIQSRSGCLCAGPYAQDMLGMSDQVTKQFELALIEKLELLRPGFVRINLPYFAPQCEVEYILDAIDFVAQHGWRFLPHYAFTVDSGEWKHRSRSRKNLVGRKWISAIDYTSGEIQWQGQGVAKVEEKEDSRPDEVVYAEYLNSAREQLSKLLTSGYVGVPDVESDFALPPSFAGLRWFVLPSEAMKWSKGAGKKMECLTIRPKEYGRNGQQVIQEESKMDTSDSATTTVASTSSTFSLIAPTTSSQPLLTTTPFVQKPSTRPSVTPPTIESSTNSNGKRPAPGPSKNQLKREAKKAKKQGAAAAAASGTEGDETKEESKDEEMTPVDGASNNNKRRAATTDDMKEDVCKNCWHVHWNAAESKSSAAAAASSSSSSAAPTSAPTTGHRSSKECTHCPCINYVPSRQRSAKEINAVGMKIQRTVGQAIKDYSMIRDGDRVLIGISGGKDSLTLFHILRNLQKKAPIKFTLGCVTVDPQTPEYDPSPLKAYFASLNIPYFYESQPILAMAKEKMDPKKQSICSFCSRMKRGILYTCLRREGYNVLALGQHLDDLAESLLMSVFHNGMLRTMKANYHAEAGDIRIIRPLIYVRERLTREYSNLADLPVINETCPACFEAPKERQRVKLLLASQEHVHTNLYSNMLQAMRPLLGMENYKYAGKMTAGSATAGASSSSSAVGAGVDADDDEGMTTSVGASSAAQLDLLRALNGIGGRTEEDEEDAAMDALCRAPGGACAIPPKKSNQNKRNGKEMTTPAPAAAPSVTTPSTTLDTSK